MKLHRFVRVVAVAAVALVSSFAWAGPNGSRRSAVVEVVERVRGAVVNIHSERTVHNHESDEVFGHTPSPNRVNGMGTGIIIDPRGYIVTNQHVVEDVSLIRVRLADGNSLTAKVVTRDPESDLALLKIDAGHPLPTMPIGTSSDIMVGETVIAIGNAYGYEHSVTVGIVSAVKRDVTLNKELSYKALIQTDASINPGNSGGPLVNINGELIGVNVAIRAGAQGIGFAIPVDNMLRVAADMLSIRKRNGVWHGLVCRDNVETSELQSIAGSSADLEKHKASDNGFTRSLVLERAEPASPALRAGLLPGDVLVRVGESRVACNLELERALLNLTAGTAVPVVVRRKGAEQKLDLVLQPVDAVSSAASDVIWRKLGLRLGSINAEQVTRSNHQLHGGLLVLDVSANSPAAKSEIMRGDILVGLHQWETVSVENVVFVLNHPDLATFNPLRFFIVRGGQLHRGWLQEVQ
jgi:serine protease Do